MAKPLCLLLIVVFSFGYMAAEEHVGLDEVRQAGLRVVEITTLDNEEPQGMVVAKPGDPQNLNITYKNKVPCQIIITLFGDTLYDSGTYEAGNSGATIRINGNTSAFFSNPLNMPYKLKLERKADLLLRDNASRYKDKHWRLLKDATSLNTIIGLKISQLLGMEWTAAYTPCNVVINGDYRGCYLLMETVRRNPDCRINCDKNTGFIVERDPYWWKEDISFPSQWYTDDSDYRWTFKYPDDDTISNDKLQSIQQYICLAEQSLAIDHYEQYIDITSFAKWLLVHDILGTRDSGGANMYLKKYDDSATSLLQMPCVWDFDSSYEVAPGSFSRVHQSSHAYFATLLKSSNRSFVNAYLALWDECSVMLNQRITAFTTTFATSQVGFALNLSWQLHNRRWGYTIPDMATCIELAQHWFYTHLPLLDAQIQQIGQETGIAQISTSHNHTPCTCYDLQGRPIQYLSKRYTINANGKTRRLFHTHAQ
ncbi:MAG: CotH kinase family protein [Prevotella sp.]|nr:CotH kinase family protein [Prevotella sp.]